MNRGLTDVQNNIYYQKASKLSRELAEYLKTTYLNKFI